MIVGLLGIGILLGAAAGAGALFAGHSVLVALGLYIAVGAGATLIGGLGVALVRGSQRIFGKNVERRAARQGVGQNTQ